MKFTDYPRDLQRIVELTPEGWKPGAKSVQFNVEPRWLDYDRESYPFPQYVFCPNQYNQCRAQWLAEMAEVDWRGLCEELLLHIERNTCTHDETIRGGAIWEICEQCGEKWADDEGGKPDFEYPAVVDKARKALEQTK